MEGKNHTMSGTYNDQRTSRRESLVGRVLHDGEYLIQQALGQGDAGKVYLATHIELLIPLAIKQVQVGQPLPDSAVAELDYRLYGGDRVWYGGMGHDFPFSTSTDHFLREALLLARLQHSAIPALYDYFFEDGYWYMVMDYLPGLTLSRYLRRYAPLHPLKALSWAMQLCDVLEYLHGQSSPVIFRNLKPSNIMLTPDGTLMLIDFGSARARQANNGSEVGSTGPAFVQQDQGGKQIDEYSDLLSLGMLLYEMLSGRRPTGGKISRNSLRHIHPAISAAVSDLVMLATRSEPRSSYIQSAYTFGQALAQVYRIEEQRVLTQHVYHHTEQLSDEEIPSPSWLSQDSLDLALAIGTHTIKPRVLPSLPNLEQRRRIREALQQAHRLWLGYDNPQLVFVDESLKRRSLMPLSQTSLVLPAVEPVTQNTHFKHKFHGLIRVSFIFALILFLVMASLQISRSFQRADMPVSDQSVGVISPTISSSWQVLPSLPSPEAENTAIYVNVGGRAYIYVSGGYLGDGRAPSYDHSFYRYDILAKHWEVVTNAQFPGMINNAAVVDEQGHLFFTAGYSTDTNDVASYLYMYQPANGILQKIEPPYQMSVGFGSAMVADQQGHLYIAQGFMNSQNPHAQADTGWYRYDIVTGQWHLLAPLPQGVGYEHLVFDGSGGILLLGGSLDVGQHQQTKNIYRYDVVQNSWALEPTTAPQLLSGAASCWLRQDQMVIVGGYDAIHHLSLSQAWFVDLHTLSWVRLAQIPSGGSVSGAIACDSQGHVFLERGASDPSSPTTDFLELTIRIS